MRSMVTDPNLVQLWGQIAGHTDSECGALFMVEALEETLDGNVSVLAFCTVGKDADTPRLIAGDFNGNVILFDAAYNVIQRQKAHKYSLFSFSR